MDPSKQALAAALLKQPAPPQQPQAQPGMLGTGMAAQAGQTLQQMPNYRDYVIEVQTQGQQALPQNDPKWQQHYAQIMGQG